MVHPISDQTATQTADQSGTNVALKLTDGRNLFFVLYLAATVVLFWAPLKALEGLAWRDGMYSFTLLMPVVILFVFYADRKKIFHRVNYSAVAGLALLLATAVFASFSLMRLPMAEQWNWRSLDILALVLVWIAGFVLFYGVRALRAAVFPCLLAFLMVPVPRGVIEGPIGVIRRGSAEIASLFFHLAGVPVFREGYTFSLPRLSIVIAQECSGIHSSLALFIGSLLIGHLYLKSAWKRLILVLAAFPIISLTNGFRIFSISMLTLDVNPAFMHGRLHRQGGSIFFALATVILFALARVMRPSHRTKTTLAAPATPGIPQLDVGHSS